MAIEEVVVPFSRLARDPVAEIEVDGVPVVVLYKRGVLSPLDNAAISRSRDVGAAGAFDRRLDGRTLSFRPAGDGRFCDRQTGSLWDVTGSATAGPLAGARLRPVVSDQQFWFALAALPPGRAHRRRLTAAEPKPGPGVVAERPRFAPTTRHRGLVGLEPDLSLEQRLIERQTGDLEHDPRSRPAT